MDDDAARYEGASDAEDYLGRVSWLLSSWLRPQDDVITYYVTKFNLDHMASDEEPSLRAGV